MVTANQRKALLVEYDDMLDIIRSGEPYTTVGLQDLIHRLSDVDCINSAASLAGEHNQRHAHDPVTVSRVQLN
jgi:hypothetical protein